MDYHHRVRDGYSYRVRKGHSDNRSAIVGRSCGMGQKNSEAEMGWAAEKDYPERALLYRRVRKMALNKRASSQ